MNFLDRKLLMAENNNENGRDKKPGQPKNGGGPNKPEDNFDWSKIIKIKI